MTVKELIRELNKIKDKDIPVYYTSESGKVREMEVYFKERKVYEDNYTFDAAVMYGEY